MSKLTTLLGTITLAAALATSSGQALAAEACWSSAAEESGIPVDLLAAIARHESSLNANARHQNEGGKSYDIGLMQINSAWLPTLKAAGISELSLYEPCTNLRVGAWILRRNIDRLGYNWNAVGAYNAGCRGLSRVRCEGLRNKYAWAIFRKLPNDGTSSAQLAYRNAVRPAGVANSGDSTKEQAASASSSRYVSITLTSEPHSTLGDVPAYNPEYPISLASE